MRAAILTLEGCYVSSAGGFADILQVANAHLRRQHGDAAKAIEWQFVSMAGGEVRASNGLGLQTHRTSVHDRYDLVFIPSLHYAGKRAFDRFLEGNSSACGWLVDQWRAGAWLAANCTGTFVLAETGLLDGRKATTTWWLEQQFRARFPRVVLECRPVLVESDRLLCAGASASYLLQAVRIVEKYCGPAIASQTAKSMLIDVSQTVQTPYLPLLTDKAHGDTVVHRAQHWLQIHLRSPVRISELAAALAVSERTLVRRFRAALDDTPLGYLQNLRIDAARSLLESGDLGIEQIGHHVGYTDTSSFSRLFRARVGYSPAAYRSRFQFKDSDADA